MDKEHSTHDDRHVGTPSEAAEPFQHPSDHSFLVQAIFEVQKSIGSLTQTITKLDSSVEAHGKKLERITIILACAGTAITLLVGIGVFVLDKVWDKLVAVIQMAP